MLQHEISMSFEGCAFKHLVSFLHAFLLTPVRQRAQDTCHRLHSEGCDERDTGNAVEDEEDAATRCFRGKVSANRGQSRDVGG